MPCSEECDDPSRTTACGILFAFRRAGTGNLIERPSSYGHSLGRCWSKLSRPSWLTAQGCGFMDVSRSHNTEITHVYHSIHFPLRASNAGLVCLYFGRFLVSTIHKTPTLPSNEYILEPVFRRRTHSARHGDRYLSSARYKPLAVHQQAC
jgi:hypothetical protein